jgi:hypothetical protein
VYFRFRGKEEKNEGFQSKEYKDYYYEQKLGLAFGDTDSRRKVRGGEGDGGGQWSKGALGSGGTDCQRATMYASEVYGSSLQTLTLVEALG